jgi:hypothetical protein
MSEPRCLVCQRPVRPPIPNQDPVVWDCAGCGYFSVPSALVEPVEAALQADPGLRPRLSQVLRLAADRSPAGHVEPLLPPEVDAAALDPLLRDRASVAPFPRTLGDRLDLALIWFAGAAGSLGAPAEVVDQSAFLARIGLTAGYVQAHLDAMHKYGWIDSPAVSGQNSRYQVTLTALGWARVEAIENGLPDSTLVFLALSNRYVANGEPADPDGLGAALRDAIAAALPAPLSAYRVENDHSAVNITDEIVANIRRARFVVADLTCARPNVYFEAGLAMGLGKPVVFTRRAGETAHFDVAAYKIIEWAPGELSAFTAALTNHLVARALIPAV